ncbi:sulfite exporter TauE/SafE family protein [Candidatus Dojkabacteria bacterium]|uniref:Sulfite exporter TauE/SafE family protein n=1 Tax=Candidatus Dojkabacteria bacterium TaxID=2099670 RepID=A0A955L6H9_9BACT|nr:sulfite exporter TauE/SafE family protein [Candidatus Dojkabacteria bacterium]
MIDVTFYAAFTAGLVTFFAPCTFVTLPAFISYISLKATESTGNSGGAIKYRIQVFLSSIVYAVGFLSVFTFLGMTATTIGSIFAENKDTLSRAGGLLIIIFGVFILLGDRIRPLHFLFQERKLEVNPSDASKGYLFPFIIGVTSAFAWTPCIGPILGSILLIAGSTTDAAYEGGALLFTYGLGITIPFLLIALTVGYSDWVIKRLSKYTAILYQASAVLLIILGTLLLVGYIDEIFGYVFRIFISLGYEPV